jgi:hypothetical protein
MEKVKCVGEKLDAGSALFKKRRLTRTKFIYIVVFATDVVVLYDREVP